MSKIPGAVILSITISALVISCSTKLHFKKDRPLFVSSPVLTKYKAVADMNDAYFVIKENHFFQFYRLLFDSVKNSSYAGKFTQHGDTLFLEFYNAGGRKLLGNKALLNPDKKEVIFFDNNIMIKKLIGN